MADACPNCGRADLMQPDVRNYQCLACGTISDIATVQPVPTLPEPPQVNNLNQPVPELSVDVVEQEANEFVTPVPAPDDPTGPVPIVTASETTDSIPDVAPDDEPAPEAPVEAPEPTPDVAPDAMSSNVADGEPVPPPL